MEDEACDDGQWLAMKSEPCCDWMADLVRRGEAKVVNTYRDLRDVVVSLMNFYDSRAEYRKDNGATGSFEEVLEVHARNALHWQQAWEALPRIYSSQYERAIRDGWLGETRKVAAYLGAPLTFVEAITIAARHSLDANEARIAQMESWIDAGGTMLTKAHIGPRRGQPGQWRDVLTYSQVERVEALGGDWMEAHGYELVTR